MKRNADRFLTATFCDDIRHEVGNKISLMGCYQGELIVPTVPIALPKLCIYASAWTLKDDPFKSLILRIVQNDENELVRIDVPSKALEESAQIEDVTATRRTVSTALAFSPFVIERPTSLRLMAVTEEGEIVGPRLLIKIARARELVLPPSTKAKHATRLRAKRKVAEKKRARVA